MNRFKPIGKCCEYSTDDSRTFEAQGTAENERSEGSRDRSLINPEFSCPVIMVLINIYRKFRSFGEYGVNQNVFFCMLQVNSPDPNNFAILIREIENFERSEVRSRDRE